MTNYKQEQFYVTQYLLVTDIIMILSQASLDPPPVTPSKVTLTNWVRLNNAPLLLPRASAVQWNDYVFVLARDGTALLYHSKHNMWSMLSKSPYTSDNLAPALTLHNGRILTMSESGDVSTFDSQLCRWTVVKDMNMSEGGGPRIIASDNSNLYSVVDLKSPVQQRQHVPSHARKTMRLVVRGGLVPQAPHSQCAVFSYDPSSKWKKICEIKSIPLKSAVVVGGSLFVHAGEDMFKLTLPTQPKVAANLKLPQPPAPIKVVSRGPPTYITGNSLPPSITSRNLPPQQQQPILQSATACASPMCAGSTLHAIKDTLFSFGGRDEDNQPTSYVLRYNPDTDTWESAGYMRNARYNATVVTMSQAENFDVIIIGGSFGSSQYVMKPRLYTETKTDNKQDNKWEDATSIVEKCTAVE